MAVLKLEVRKRQDASGSMSGLRMYLPPQDGIRYRLNSPSDWKPLWAESSDMHSPQSILVCIAQLLEDGSRRLGARWLAIHHVEEAQLVLNNVCNSLCVGGGA